MRHVSILSVVLPQVQIQEIDSLKCITGSPGVTEVVVRGDGGHVSERIELGVSGEMLLLSGKGNIGDWLGLVVELVSGDVEIGKVWTGTMIRHTWKGRLSKYRKLCFFRIHCSKRIQDPHRVLSSPQSTSSQQFRHESAHVSVFTVTIDASQRKRASRKPNSLLFSSSHVPGNLPQIVCTLSHDVVTTTKYSWLVYSPNGSRINPMPRGRRQSARTMRRSRTRREEDSFDPIIHYTRVRCW